MEVLFAKAFLSTPGSTRGFVKPKGSKKRGNRVKILFPRHL